MTEEHKKKLLHYHKIIMLFVLLGMACFTVLTYAAGLRTDPHNKQLVVTHVRYANQALGWTIALIFLIEIRVRVKRGVNINRRLYIHIACASVFLLTMLIMRFWLNGVGHPHIHPVLAAANMLGFAGMFATGIPMILLF